MKNFIKYLLQMTLGYNRYLRVFSNYKIRTLKNDAKEKDFFAFMDAIEKEGAIMDVGANIGIMTYHLSKRFADRKIFAVEPMPNNFSVLKELKDKKKLNNVELIPCAVGEEKTTIKMILPIKGRVKMQGLAHVVHDSIKEWNEGEIIEVSCEKLDNVASRDAIAGIKMDIENFEIFALRGASRILKEFKPVVYLELWDNENREKCFEFLTEMDYKAFVYIDKNLILYNPDKHTKQNFIFKMNEEA